MSDEACREMPKYVCHKQVWALKIKDIVSYDGATYIVPEEEGYAKFRVEDAYVAQHKPQVGGYYVVYKGGYTSYSPAEAFEDGYTMRGEWSETLHTDHNGVKALTVAKGSVLEGHRYCIRAGDTEQQLDFQLGPVAENGVNGITTEALLAVLIHRTEVLNSRFHCEENDWAIAHMKRALGDLQQRTKGRITRGVEGLNVA